MRYEKYMRHEKLRTREKQLKLVRCEPTRGGSGGTAFSRRNCSCVCYVIGFLSVIEDGFLSVIEDGFLTPLRTPPCEPPRGVCGRLRGQGLLTAAQGKRETGASRVCECLGSQA